MVEQNILHKEIGEAPKPVYLYNHEGFWDTFITILEKLELRDEVTVLSSIPELETALNSAYIHPISTAIPTN